MSSSMADNRTYYDAFAATYEARRHEPYHRFLDDSELAVVAPLAAGRDVLEVGCGTGLVLERLADVARHATGVDLSPGMLAKAHARGLDVREGDATALPFPDASFDVTCSFKVLAHVPDLARALAEMARVTRPGGFVVAELYNAHSVRALVKHLKPASRVSAVHTDEDVYTRYDRLAEVRTQLPVGTRLVSVDGVRVLSPAALPFNLPLVGPAWARAERLAARTPLRRYAGFLILTLERL